MSFPVRSIVAGLGVLAVLSLACSDGSGPSKPKGMSGTWLVAPNPIDESGAGQGQCEVTPAFMMTIDSTSQRALVTIPTTEVLDCNGGGLTFNLSLDDTLRVVDDGTGPQHAVFLVDLGDPNHVVAFAWFDIEGDSIGGNLIDANLPLSLLFGKSTWSAVRQ